MLTDFPSTLTVKSITHGGSMYSNRLRAFIGPCRVMTCTGLSCQPSASVIAEPSGRNKGIQYWRGSR